MRFAVYLFVFLLLIVSCGGGGSSAIPSPGGGNNPPPSEYPQHYTTDLDGIWEYDVSNVEIDDPELLYDETPSEFESDMDGFLMEIMSGIQVYGSLPMDMELTLNRVSKLSPSQYELVVRLVGTRVIDGNEISLTVDSIETGFANSERDAWTGSGHVTFWAQEEGGSQLYLWSIDYDFVLSKTMS